MAINANYAGGIERSLPKELTTTAVTTIFEAVDNSAILGGFVAVNDSGSAVLLSVFLYDGSSDLVFFEEELSANSTREFGFPIRPYGGEEIRAQAATANTITITPAIIRTHSSEVIG